jgi:uncharacterized protein YkwD
MVGTAERTAEAGLPVPLSRCYPSSEPRREREPPLERVRDASHNPRAEGVGLRRLAAAALAVPVIASIYAPFLTRRRVAMPIGAGLMIVVLVVVGLASLARPAATTGTPPTVAAPLTSSRFTATVGVNHDPRESVVVQFTAPMNHSSVEATLRIDPTAAVQLQWNASSTQLDVAPTTGWSPGTYYTVTVGADAVDASGHALSAPARTAFLIRSAARATIGVSKTIGAKVPGSAFFQVTFDQPVDVASATAAFRIVPAVKGRISSVTGSDGTQFTFIPLEPLAARTNYTVTLAGVIVDAAGQPVASPTPLRVTTVDAANVVRFRPARGATNVDATTLVSVRFSSAMNRAATAKAFSVIVAGKPVPGSISWAEGNTVLVFRPTQPFAAGAGVGIRVTGDAVSGDGTPIGNGGSATFRVVPPAPAPAPVKPAAATPKAAPKAAPATTKGAATPTPKPVTRPKTGGSSTPGSSGGSGGGSVGGGAWAAVESYYLGLMNCTRTGGWVSSSGACTSPGGRDVAALWIDKGISDNVSRPYAKYLATHGLCNHFYDGSPADRLARAGFHSYRWGENIGCPSGMSPNAAMVYTQQFFQSEKSYNGGHYVNLMNAAYDRVGIGVWVSNGRVLVVIDFYHP